MVCTAYTRRMKKILITGGNSGIGKACAQQLVRQGHHVVMVGRDADKGQRAAGEVAGSGGKADFMAADLSSMDGMRAFARAFTAEHGGVDVLIQGAGVLITDDVRTVDDLHIVFAVNFLSRFLVGELLLPLLEQSSDPRMVLLVAGVPLTSSIDFSVFPRYKPFPGMGALSSIQIANFHWAQDLARRKPQVSVGVVNAGLVASTDIMRAAPGWMRAGFKLVAPLVTVPVEVAAANLTHAASAPRWPHARYWPKPGKTSQANALELDRQVSARVAQVCRALTGLDRGTAAA
jgi:NAD(P)-dependent dehydrogenase (short-subunit alcohol dehydrogenase family)